MDEKHIRVYGHPNSGKYPCNLFQDADWSDCGQILITFLKLICTLSVARGSQHARPRNTELDYRLQIPLFENTAEDFSTQITG